MKRTGKLLLQAVCVSAAFVAAAPIFSQARADEARFTAQVDRTEIGLDDSVSLRLVMESGGDTPFRDPSFNAPDFELVNQYQDTQIRSLYENGQFMVRNTQTVTFVLRPTKVG